MNFLQKIKIVPSKHFLRYNFTQKFRKNVEWLQRYTDTIYPNLRKLLFLEHFGPGAQQPDFSCIPDYMKSLNTDLYKHFRPFIEKINDKFLRKT